MKVIVSYTRLGQYFFYVYHLSQWHFSSVKEVADIYKKRTGALSKEESEALKNIRKIFKEFGFGPKYIGNIFLRKQDKEIKKSLYKLLGAKKAQVVIKAFYVLRPRLEKLWFLDKPRAERCIYGLKRLVKQKRFKRLVINLDLIFGPIPKALGIRLLMLPEEYGHIGGSANTSGNIITLEIRNKKDVISGIFVSLHELSHKLVNSRGFNFKSKKKISKVYANTFPHFGYMSKEEAIEELLLLFFLPDGYLARKFDNNIPLDKHIRKFPNKLKNYIKLIVKNNLPVSQNDVDFLKNFLTLNKKKRG